MKLRTDSLCGVNEQELSRQLVRLIDVMYALVLVQGAINYRRIFTRDDFFDWSHHASFIPVLVALILVYVTAIQSFVDFHLASETDWYQIAYPVRRTIDLARFYVDVLIVATYSFLLLKFHVLVDTRWADLSVAFWAFPVIFALYVLWGVLRRLTLSSGRGGYSVLLLVLLLAGYVALAIGYELGPGGWERNAICLGIALILMVLYRILNWPRPRAAAQGADPAAGGPAASAEEVENP